MENEIDDQLDYLANDLGRYTPEHTPTGEDMLYAIILAMVQQSCSTTDPDKLDSWAISAYEHAIETLAEIGFVALDGEGRIGARLLPKAQNFEAWMDSHARNR